MKLVQYRDFSRGNYDNIRERLGNYDWYSLFNDFNIDNCIEIFYTIIDRLIIEYIPLVRKTNKNFPHWFSSATIAIYNEKKMYHDTWKKLQNPRDHDTFSLLRARLKKNINLDYKQYVYKSENTISTHINRFWNFVKIKKRNAINCLPNTIKWDNTSVTKLPDIVNLFAQYFGSVYTNNSDTCNVPRTDYYNISLPYINLNQDSILKCLECLVVDKAPGPDGIHPIFIKNCANQLSLPLYLLFQKSLYTSVFPKKWKQTYVTPIHKKGSKNDVTNYRPISKISIFGKIFESLITDELYSKFTSHIIPQQHGFTKKRSSTSNLTVLSEFIHTNLDKKQQVDVIYTDISKAFDQVDHTILIRKLENSGMHGSLLKWLVSYLKGRTQQVCIDGVLSNPIKVTSGVPQGSHLGPLLFILYINDISHYLHYCKFLLYADDLKIYSSICTNEDQTLLQNDISSISNYFSLNRLNLNISKCHLVRFTRNTINIFTQNYYINGISLNESYEISDLGITYDSQLSFNTHINNIVNRAYRMLGFIIRVCKDFRHLCTYMLLYKSLVRCHVEYCIPVWNPHYVSHANTIERIQKKFAICMFYKFRSIMPCATYSYTEVRTFLGLDLLSIRRRNVDLIFLYKIVRNVIDTPDLLNCITFSTSQLRTRSTSTFSVSRSRTNIGYFSPIKNMMRSFETNCSSVDIFSIPLCTYKRYLQNIQ